MNLLGKTYLSVRPYLKQESSAGESRQEALRQQFLHEWENHEAIDQQPLLATMLDYTRTHVPFYRHYFAEHPHKDPTRIGDWPVLTRNTLRERFQDLQSDQPPDVKSWTHASGGSTGKPVAVTHDEYFAAKAQALRDLCARLFFEGPHYNKLILWGMSEELEKQKSGDDSLKRELKDKLLQLGGLKTTHINTFNFSQEKFQQCVHILKTQKPDFIFGYGGSVYQLAKYLEEHGIRPPRSPRKIATTAQTLYPFMREKIESVFGCQVCDHYGSREAGPLAWQHPAGDMYLPKFFSHVEVVDSQGDPCAPNEQGRILVTALHNYSMPLIRYETGDSGVQGGETEIAGYPCKTLARIAGKSNEEFVRRDGTLVHGQFFINLFYYRPWLDEFHVVQKDYELIDILYVPAEPGAEPPSNDIEEIESRIKKVMSDACEIRWQRVNEIPPTRAGKRLYIRSEVR